MITRILQFRHQLLYVVVVAVVISAAIWRIGIFNKNKETVPFEQTSSVPPISPIVWNSIQGSQGIDMSYPPDFSAVQEGASTVISYEYVASSGARLRVTPSDDLFVDESSPVPVLFGPYHGYDITSSDAPKNTRRLALNVDGKTVWADMAVGEGEHQFAVLVYYQIMETMLARMTHSI